MNFHLWRASAPNQHELSHIIIPDKHTKLDVTWAGGRSKSTWSFPLNHRTHKPDNLIEERSGCVAWQPSSSSINISLSRIFPARLSRRVCASKRERNNLIKTYEMTMDERKILLNSRAWNLHGMPLKRELDKTAQHELINIYYHGK